MEALVDAWASPGCAARVDGLDQTPLGAGLTGWGGACAPWAKRREAVAWILRAHPASTPLPLQLRDRRHPLELLAHPDVEIARALSLDLPRPSCPCLWISPLPLPEAPVRAWRHALGLGAQAPTVGALMDWLGWLAAQGMDLEGPAGSWVLQSLGNSRLGAAWLAHPAACFQALESAGVSMGTNLLRLLEPRSGHGMADVLALGRALGQWPFRKPLRGFDPAHFQSLDRTSRWLARYSQAVDWVEPLAARFRMESLDVALASPDSQGSPRGRL